jgi:hypothetical protein
MKVGKISEGKITHTFSFAVKTVPHAYYTSIVLITPIRTVEITCKSNEEQYEAQKQNKNEEQYYIAVIRFYSFIL